VGGDLRVEWRELRLVELPAARRLLGHRDVGHGAQRLLQQPREQRGLRELRQLQPTDDSILTLVVDLTNYTDATLSFYEWYDLFSNWDWAEVYANGTPVIQHCESSHTIPTAWVQKTADLTPYVGGVVTIEFHMMASTVVNHAGWYIDDLMIDGTMIPVELQSLSVE